MHLEPKQCALYLYAAVLYLLIPKASCEVRDSLYRQSRSASGDTINILSDGKVIVVTFVDASGSLQECTVIKDNSTIPKQLFKEVVASHSDNNLQFRSLEVDVRKLGRKCRKYIRDVKRKKEHSRSLTERRLVERLKLDEPLSGTQWCSRLGRPRYSREVVEKTALNNCCREFHTNSDVIPGFSFRHHLFNALPWSIASCETSRTFQRCLRDEGSEESTKLSIKFFDLLKLPCYELIEQEICAEYSPWYDTCKTKKTLQVAREHIVDHKLN